MFDHLSGLCRDASWLKSYMASELVFLKELMQVTMVEEGTEGIVCREQHTQVLPWLMKPHPPVQHPHGNILTRILSAGGHLLAGHHHAAAAGGGAPAPGHC